MSFLRLKFVDPDGSGREVEVTADRWRVGRLSTGETAIADSRLSREHLLIEREGKDFFAIDVGSSNGTQLNGEPLTDRIALANGDVLNLGGLEISIELSAEDEPADAGEVFDHFPSASDPTEQAPAPTAAGGTGIPVWFFFLAPALAVAVIAVVLGALWLTGGKKATDANFVYSADPVESRERDAPTPVRSSPDRPESNSISQDTTQTLPTPPAVSPGASKIEKNAAAFLRKAAQNDPRAFVTGEQAKLVEAKVRSMTGIADNLASARKSSAQLRSLAASKNLKPDLLAAAALAKLGSSRGDVLSTAASMADVLDRLAIQIGNEFGDDCLLMLAAYDQGSAGDFLKLRNMLQDLATRSSAPVREIRSIWYLKKQGKITDAEFDMALRFLAAGTIMQNPRDAGVNAEAVIF